MLDVGGRLGVASAGSMPLSSPLLSLSTSTSVDDVGAAKREFEGPLEGEGSTALRTMASAISTRMTAAARLVHVQSIGGLQGA